MNDAFFDFEWTVAPQYEWRDLLDERGNPVVVPSKGLRSLESPATVELAWKSAQESQLDCGPLLHPVIKNSVDVRRYHPMQRENAALFRQFADLQYGDKASLLAFAHQYGALGLPPLSQSRRFRDENGDWVDHHAFGEPHLRWAIEICLMREGLRYQNRKGRRTFEAYRRLKWLFDRNLQHVQARLGFDGAGEPKLTLEPLTLISAMWLQLALAATGEKQFVACKFCRRLFEISTEQTGFRSHREFCSDSCKTKDYRKRKRTAVRLASEGMTAREISARTHTEMATVRAWMALPKQGRAKPGGA